MSVVFCINATQSFKLYFRGSYFFRSIFPSPAFQQPSFCLAKIWPKSSAKIQQQTVVFTGSVHSSYTVFDIIIRNIRVFSHMHGDHKYMQLFVVNADMKSQNTLSMKTQFNSHYVADILSCQYEFVSVGLTVASCHDVTLESPTGMKFPLWHARISPTGNFPQFRTPELYHLIYLFSGWSGMWPLGVWQ